MQARSSFYSRARDGLGSFLTSAGDLSRFQIGAIVTLILLLLLGATVAYMRSRPREIQVRGSTSTEAPTGGRSRMLTVHVAGAVVNPGLYRVKEGSRVADALSEAGGATPNGLLDELNLAARLKDGEKVLVPPRVTQGQDEDEPGQAGGSSLVNVNTASAEELEKLPGVGPSLAERIVEYRKRNGSFSSAEELDNVEGIGPRRIETLKGLVTI